MLSLLESEALSFAIAVDFAGDFVVGLAFACIAGTLGDFVGDRDRWIGEVEARRVGGVFGIAGVGFGGTGIEG